MPDIYGHMNVSHLLRVENAAEVVAVSMGLRLAADTYRQHATTMIDANLPNLAAQFTEFAEKCVMLADRFDEDN